MKVRIFLLNLFLLCSFLIVGKEGFVDITAHHPRLMKQKKMQFCYITFVSINGKTFLVKQKRNINSLLSVVNDALAAHIAHSIDSKIAHKVMIIPAFKKFPGKIWDDWPATIHTLAGGATLKSKRSPYKKMNIKQASQGLRREMLYWMAKHKQLVTILALDTFLCNHDRHRGNLFYNSKTDTFCAIDMDCLFRNNLASLARHNLLHMVDHDLFPLRTKEFLALIKYKEILETLVSMYQVEDILILFDSFLQEAGLVEGSSLYTPKIQEEIDLSRRMIRQNYRDVKQLIVVLDDIIKKALLVQPGLR